MALFHTQFFSQTLGMAVPAEVILPQQQQWQRGKASEPQEKRWPVLWLLHGVTDDCTTWQRRTSIERYAAVRGLAVVMPSAHLSRYRNMAHGGRFYDYISEELPEIMRDFFPLSPSREDNFIAGVSMGGFGSMYIGLSKPDNYAAIGCISAGLSFPMPQWRSPLKSLSPEKYHYLVFGDKNLGQNTGEEWLLAQQNIAQGRPLPRIYHTCGSSDFLLQGAHDTRDFFQSLEGNPYSYRYEEHAGGHDWDFWDLHIQYFLDFLGLPAAENMLN